MGSCPVCLKSLIKEENLDKPIVNPSKDQSTKFAFGQKKFLPPALLPAEEVVVSTKCGHLFHKVCLRDYIVTFRDITKQASVECPICQERIVMNSTLVVDLRANNRCTHKTDKEIKFADIMSRELSGQSEVAKKKIEEINGDIEKENQLITSLETEQAKNYAEWKTKQSILKEYEGLMEAIDKSERNRDVLKTENLELASVYICMLTQSTPCPLPKVVPRELKQYLKIILEHEDFLKTFIQIIAPLRSSSDNQVSPEELARHMIQRIRMLTPKPIQQTQLEKSLKNEIQPKLKDSQSSDYSIEILEPKKRIQKTKKEKPIKVREDSVSMKGDCDDSDDDSSFDESSNCSVINNPCIPAAPQHRKTSRRPNHWSENLKMVKSKHLRKTRNTAIRSESSESDEHSPNKTKERKLRSKITKRDRDKRKGDKNPRIKTGLGKNNTRSVAVLIYSKKDYANLARPTSSKSVRKTRSSRKQRLKEAPTEKEHKPKTNPEKETPVPPVQKNNSLEQNRILSNSSSGDSLTDGSVASAKQYVSTGSQMSSHCFLGSLRDTILTPLPLHPSERVNSTSSSCKTLEVPTFKSVSSNANIKVPWSRPGWNQLPPRASENIKRPFTGRISVVPYSSSSSSVPSLSQNSTGGSNTSFGFELDPDFSMDITL